MICREVFPEEVESVELEMQAEELRYVRNTNKVNATRDIVKDFYN